MVGRISPAAVRLQPGKHSWLGKTLVHSWGFLIERLDDWAGGQRRRCTSGQHLDISTHCTTSSSITWQNTRWTNGRTSVLRETSVLDWGFVGWERSRALVTVVIEGEGEDVIKSRVLRLERDWK